MASLTPATEGFILHWGEMGTKWGINRTVAQIHALLYLSPEPLNAEQIAETLSVARSNVSNSLHELQSWGIVKVVHVMGDRRDHYESMKDVWEMFQIILDERKKREIDPTLAVLRDLTAKARKSGAKDAYTHERLNDMLGVLRGHDDMVRADSADADRGVYQIREDGRQSSQAAGACIVTERARPAGR